MARKNKVNPNEAALYSQYKKRAKKKGLPFKLTRLGFKRLTQQPCYICGAEPAQKYIQSHKIARYKTPFVYNGIDRLDSKRGYVRGNVMTCCGTCNCAKKEQTLVAFLHYLHRCYKVAIEPYLPKEHAVDDTLDEDTSSED